MNYRGSRSSIPIPIGGGKKEAGQSEGGGSQVACAGKGSVNAVPGKGED